METIFPNEANRFISSLLGHDSIISGCLSELSRMKEDLYNNALYKTGMILFLAYYKLLTEERNKIKKKNKKSYRASKAIYKEYKEAHKDIVKLLNK